MVIKFGFATHPNSGGSLPIFHLGFTGHFPAVSREMIVKTFRIVLCPFDRRKIVCNFFERGSNKRRAFACDFVRLVRTFFTLVREFLIYILILIIIIIIIIIGIHRIRAHTIASVCMRPHTLVFPTFVRIFGIFIAYIRIFGPVAVYLSPHKSEHRVQNISIGRLFAV